MIKTEGTVKMQLNTLANSSGLHAILGLFSLLIVVRNIIINITVNPKFIFILNLYWNLLFHYVLVQ